MANVKVFADRQTDRQTDKQTDRRTGQKLYSPDLSIWGHKKTIETWRLVPLIFWGLVFVEFLWDCSGALVDGTSFLLSWQQIDHTEALFPTYSVITRQYDRWRRIKRFPAVVTFTKSPTKQKYNIKQFKFVCVRNFYL
jgi:hypothetical protein